MKPSDLHRWHLPTVSVNGASVARMTSREGGSGSLPHPVLLLPSSVRLKGSTYLYTRTFSFQHDAILEHKRANDRFLSRYDTSGALYLSLMLCELRVTNISSIECFTEHVGWKTWFNFFDCLRCCPLNCLPAVSEFQPGCTQRRYTNSDTVPISVQCLSLV